MNISAKNKVLLQELADERGAGTAFAMLFALICIGIGGLAIDSANVWSVKQRLQSATDISAHAAAISMVFPDDPDGPTGTPTEVAIATLLANAPEAQFGVALQASDVEIGFWHPVAGKVIESHLDELGNNLDKAISVTARLDGEVGNVVPTFLLKLIGFDYWKVSTRSVFIRDTPWCVDGGFIAAGMVDIASNNAFYNGFCMHGNEGVDVNDNVIFGEGVRLSMPDSASIDDGGMLALKGTTYDWADGKDNQIGDQWLEPSLSTVASITAIKAALLDPYSPNLPDYFNNQVPDVIEINVTPATPLTADQLASGAIYDISCPNKGLDIPDDIVISDVIIIADCKINFGQGAVISSSTILTTNTGTQSMNGPSSGMAPK